MQDSQSQVQISDDLNSTEPGAPRWWVDRLYRRLDARQSRFTHLENYILGEHALPMGDPRYAKAFKEIQRKSRTNYTILVRDATTARMRSPDAFEFGQDPQGPDDSAFEIWAASNMQMQSPIAVQMAATFGVVYGIVSPPQDGPNGVPVITIEDPRSCIVEFDPLKPFTARAGLKRWEDDVDGYTYAALYLPEFIYLYRSTVVQQNRHVDNKVTVTDSLRPSSGGPDFTIVSVQRNPLGDVPLVEGHWQPTHGTMSAAEHENIIDIQDRINHVIMDRMVISKTQAFHQRYVTGLDANKKHFDPGHDRVWAVEDPDATFGDFQTADLRQALEAARDDIGDLIAISQTPATYLTNRMINVAGNAMSLDQSALVAKVRLRMEAMSFFYIRLLKLAFKYQGDSKADEIYTNCIWPDPEMHTVAELADAGSKWDAIGIPIDLIMKRQGWSPEDVQHAVEEKRRQEELAQQQAQQQADLQMQIAEARGFGNQMGEDPMAAKKVPPNQQGKNQQGQDPNQKNQNQNPNQRSGNRAQAGAANAGSKSGGATAQKKTPPPAPQKKTPPRKRRSG